MELYTGELLFGTHENLEHLALMDRGLWFDGSSGWYRRHMGLGLVYELFAVGKSSQQEVFLGSL